MNYGPTTVGTAAELDLNDHEQITLCEVLDRVLNKGVVVSGEITISVADIDLVYLGLQLVLTSIETGGKARRQAVAGE